jgi:Bifunctional DNA primase/polymerase, N-terminal/AAA domain
MNNTVLEAALNYLAKGWSVIPIKQLSKEPLVTWAEFQKRQATEGEIHKWFADWPEANVAIVTGRISNLIVVDVDPRNDGFETILQLVDEHGDLPPTITAQSGGGGEHFYFSYPSKHPLSTRKNALGPGVDLKADGGYIVAPPSRHPSGGLYRWDSSPDNTKLDEPPAWMVLLAGKTKNSTQPAGAISDWSSALRGAPEGQRHTRASQIAGHYIRLGRDPKEVETLTIGFAAQCDPPYDFDDVRRIVRDLAAKAGKEVSDDFDPLGERTASDETAFRPFSAAEILRREPEPVNWVWEPFLPNGVLSVLASPAKVGKSTFVYPLALAVAKGQSFLGFPTKRSGVCYSRLRSTNGMFCFVFGGSG